MKSKNRILAEKSLSAMLAAVEIYNKPAFSYREESFAILAINAWELLLKARILQADGNRMAALLDYERRTGQDGKATGRMLRKKNRAGNHITIGLFRAYDRLVNDYGDALPTAVRTNLDAMVEMRDNAVHFYNSTSAVDKAVGEIAAACVKNYLTALNGWFALDLTQHRVFLMPLSFISAPENVEALSLKAEERHFLDYIRSLVDKSEEDPGADYNVALRVEVQVRRSKDVAATPFVISDSPAAIPVRLDEADIREKYPWTYDMLSARLQKRYSNFKAGDRYHELRRTFEKDPNLCHERQLDPGNPKSSKKRFYNSNILKMFDDHYQRAPPEIASVAPSKTGGV